VVMMAGAARQFCHSEDYSGVHWLFVTEKVNHLLCVETPIGSQDSDDHCAPEEEPDSSATAMCMRRIDCQYHWHNNNFESFDHFLSHCTSKRRKTIRRERRYVTDASLKVRRRLGDTLSDEEWKWVHELYSSTYDRKWGNPSLTLAFFKRIGRCFGGNVLIVFAYRDDSDNTQKPIACSVMFIGKSVLYGRYWGCTENHNSLHFETCYYQGIEFCIERGLTVFEPGAQGEHKITRGFEPTITQSAHYIAHPGFRAAIAEFLDEESEYVEQRCAGLTNLLPYKQTPLKID